MIQILVLLLALFIALLGLTLIVAGPGHGGRVMGTSAKSTFQIVRWVLRPILRLLFLGAGIRILTKPRPREPRY